MFLEDCDSTQKVVSKGWVIPSRTGECDFITFVCDKYTSKCWQSHIIWQMVLSYLNIWNVLVPTLVPLMYQSLLMQHPKDDGGDIGFY